MRGEGYFLPNSLGCSCVRSVVILLGMLCAYRMFGCGCVVSVLLFVVVEVKLR